MTKSLRVLKKIYDNLKFKYHIEAGLATTGFVSQYPPYTDNPEDDYVDVPDAVDTPYVTHRALGLPRGSKRGNKVPFKYPEMEQEIFEQEEDEGPSPEETAADVGAEAGEEAGAAAGAEAGEMGGDIEGGEEIPGAGEMGDEGMGDIGGMGGQEEEQKSAGELGRIYELKKIYSRLTSLEGYLANESDPKLLNIRNTVSQAIELFEIISANFDAYKEKLDEIIVTYYKFLQEVYDTVKSIYKKQYKKDAD